MTKVLRDFMQGLYKYADVRSGTRSSIHRFRACARQHRPSWAYIRASKLQAASQLYARRSWKLEAAAAAHHK